MLLRSETIWRTWLEQAAAHRGDPGALLPAVRGDPAGCVGCAGPPLRLQASPQAGPGGASGRSDVNVARQKPQRSDLRHEHLRLGVGWENLLPFVSRLWSFSLLAFSKIPSLLLLFASCRAATAGPANHSSNHRPAGDHRKGSIRRGVAGQVEGRGRGG